MVNSVLNPQWVRSVNTPPAGPSGTSYIAAIAGSGTGSYFVDQNNNPMIFFMSEDWALPANAGQWSSGNWQQEIHNYLQSRSAQGFTAWSGVAWGNQHIGSGMNDGRTWDGVYPLLVNGTPGDIVTGSETVALNPPFWTRIDYLINTAKTFGMAVFLNMGLSYDFTALGGMWYNLTGTQATQFGSAIATWYPQATFPNLWWMWGDDTPAGSFDALFSDMLTGMRNAGDTRPAGPFEYEPETNSHIEFDTKAIFSAGGWGVTNATVNWTYTYIPPYVGVQDGYHETGTTPIMVVWGDGAYYGDTDNSTPDYTSRRFVWWSLAAGARGVNITSENVWQWTSGAPAAVTSDPTGTWMTAQVKNVVTYFTSLPNWWKLAPDTTSTLVTSGRGTPATPEPPPGTGPNYGDSDNYVVASYVADGSLAVIYCGQHFSIGINQSVMQSGYSATWVDPWSCATTSTTASSSYNSTGQGNNSAGNPDWVLVLHKP